MSDYAALIHLPDSHDTLPFPDSRFFMYDNERKTEAIGYIVIRTGEAKSNARIGSK